MTHSNSIAYPTSNTRMGETSTPAFTVLVPHYHAKAYCFHCAQYDIRNGQPFVAAQYRCYDASCCADGNIFACGDVYTWKNHMKDVHGVDV